ncbi:hypothetical protein NPIL_351171 [Nephila pilipes]|uniref:Uncharacterized protein n=1 Tax=Nephila pilipes TaxID=299642 RepID=A0A8X6N1V3_NEPPI|nr:hypothetical protein NPIL_351171 [Nephila pilipes]
MLTEVIDETVLIIDEDFNRLMREKEKEAILKEKEKCHISDKSESTKEAIEKYSQIINYLKAKAHTNEELEIVKDCLETCANKMTMKLKSFPPSAENFPPNKNIRSQRQQQESRPFKKQKHAHAT